jgi:ketosteroid isomerase-like protein
MSQKSVEIAKRALEALNRRDLDSYDEMFTPEFEWFPALPTAVESQSYRGRDGVERYFEEIADTWGVFRLADDEYRPAGESVLLSVE